MSKHNVQDVEFVKCPYCPDDDKNKFKMLHWKHLKCNHVKTIDDVLRDFPDIPTMTLADYKKKQNTAKMGTQVSKETHSDLKPVNCIYINDDDCPGKELMVPKNYPNDFVCDTCRNLGKQEVDGRRLEHANEARIKTNLRVRGVEHCQQDPEVNKKMVAKQRDGGGVGFERKELRDNLIGKTTFVLCTNCGLNEVEVGLTSSYKDRVICEECEKKLNTFNGYHTPDGRVVCQECKRAFDQIHPNHLRRFHNMTLEEYKEKYPDAPTITEEYKKLSKTPRKSINPSEFNKFMETIYDEYGKGEIKDAKMILEIATKTSNFLQNQ